MSPKERREVCGAALSGWWFDDRLVCVGFLVGHQIVSQGFSSLRQLDRALVGLGLCTTVDGTVAADRRIGGERKRFDPLDVADQPHDQPIEPHRHRQLVELFDRARQSGPVQ
jgi:hypothetical protein